MSRKNAPLLIMALSLTTLSSYATANVMRPTDDGNRNAGHDLNLSIGGYIKSIAGVYDSKFINQNHREFQTASQVYFTASKKAANGVEYNAFVELYTSTDSSINTSEAYITMKSDYGVVGFGDHQSPADRFTFYAPNLGFGQAVRSYNNVVGGFGQSINAEFEGFVDASSSSQIGPKALDSENSTRIYYLTPRVWGLRAGISYAPEFNSGENIIRTKKDGLTAANPSINPTAALNNTLIDYVQPNQDGNRDPTLDNRGRGSPKAFFKNSFRDFIELGATCQKKFQEITYRLSTTYVHADHKSGATAAGKRRDINAWSVGAQLDVAKDWRVGGSYVDNQGSGQLKSKKKQDRKAFNFGVVYEPGPLGLSANIITEDLGGSNKHGSGKYFAYGFGTTYQLAPGIMVGSDLVFYERKFGKDDISRFVVPSELKQGANKSKGYVWLVGTQLNF